MGNDAIRPAKRFSKPRRSDASALTLKYASTVLGPLRRTEGSTATRLALASLLGDKTIQKERTRLYGPTLRVEKPKRRGGAPVRIVWVCIRDRDRGIVHEISVVSGKVVGHVANPHSNLPFSDEERDEARRLIRADAVVGKAAARKSTEIDWFSPAEHPHSSRRVIGARLMRVQSERLIRTIGEAEIELDQGVLRKAVLYRTGERQ
jgi:hypothetical protein